MASLAQVGRVLLVQHNMGCCFGWLWLGSTTQHATDAGCRPVCAAADLQVQQAFTLMNASLNAFLAAVPVKYQRYRV